MPIGPLELAIVVVLALLLFGYKKLPELGRSAGEGLRKVKDVASERLGSSDEVPTSIGRSAGRGVRELRELREAVSTRPRDAEGPTQGPDESSGGSPEKPRSSDNPREGGPAGG